MTEGECNEEEGGRAAWLNSLAWQRSGEMIVGNCPACRCVERVRERGAEWEERSGGGVRLCARNSVCPPAQLCWKAASVWSSQLGLFYLVCWSGVNSLRGYSLAWHGRVWSGLPVALWMREQQQVDWCVKHGTNKDFIPPGTSTS